MGGKGQRRREKNYLAAHGGNNTLPPPPKTSDLDAVPAKLRKLMEFKNPSSKLGLSDSVKISKDKTKLGKREGDSTVHRKKNPDDDEVCHVVAAEKIDESEDISNTKANMKKKTKRKRKTMDDLRLQMMNKELAGSSSKRRERRTKYSQEKKKKSKKVKTDERVVDFPQHENIKFGEVVQGPPKLTFPKVTTTFRDASHERLRLEAVEAYRNRKGWASRPGILLPPVSATLPSKAA
ncbi:uncharacterized protein [Aristolochia californica]|uniref:uncharacterized protein n=1 Tax=Aristolochia californica TaxID=171875 RepID=UPI0035D9B314